MLPSVLNHVLDSYAPSVSVALALLCQCIKEAVDNHDDPDSKPPISQTFRIMKVLEHFPTYLESKLGVSEVVLAYVIREDDVALTPLPGQAHG